MPAMLWQQLSEQHAVLDRQQGPIQLEEVASVAAAAGPHALES